MHRCLAVTSSAWIYADSRFPQFYLGLLGLPNGRGGPSSGSAGEETPAAVARSSPSGDKK